MTDRVVRADPGLANIFPLSRNTDWMNGIQFYLDDDAPIGPGHQIYLDSPWALTSVSQAQFWPDVDLSRFGDGNIRGVISVDHLRLGHARLERQARPGSAPAARSGTRCGTS